MDMCRSDEPACTEANHRARDVGTPNPQRFRNPILDEPVRRRGILRDVGPVEEIEEAPLRDRCLPRHREGQFHGELKFRGDQVILHMAQSSVSVSEARWTPEDGRREALDRCCALLQREGFTVSWVLTPPSSRANGSPDLLAADGSRLIRIVVLLNGEVDDKRTRARIRSALRQGETRVYVPWPLRWRLLSNLERWRLPGTSVVSW